MAKIIVPQELQNKIIDLYQNKKYTRVQIKKELNLTFGDSVILRILNEHQIPIRSNPGAQKGGRKKQQISEEIQKEIIELYKKGYGLKKIVKELNLPFGFDKVKTILKDNNIALRTIQEAHQVCEFKELRKYFINDDYCLETHNGAWILGFLAADGYLPLTHGARNRIVLSVSSKDEEILYAIAKELDYTGSIKQYKTSDGFPFSSLSFASRKLRNQIEAYGIVNNKTFILKKLPNLPEEYMIDFMAGYFDGDGSVVSRNKATINLSFTSANKEWLIEINNYLYNHYKIIGNITNYKNRNAFDLKYDVTNSIKLGQLFYKNNRISLERKKQHFLSTLALREQLPRV